MHSTVSCRRFLAIAVLPVVLVVVPAVAQGYDLEWSGPVGQFAMAVGANAQDASMFDMDGDGVPEIVLASAQRETVYVYDARWHDLRWQFALGGDPIDVAGFADIDADGLREAVLVVGGSENTVRLVDWQTGAIELTIGGGSLYASDPSIADIDMDLKPEIAVMIQSGVDWHNSHLEIWGDTSLTAVGRMTGRTADTLLVTPVSPNPFSKSADILLRLPTAQYVSVTIHDVQGRMVRKLLDQRLDGGQHRLTWDGRDEAGRHVASGIYFYRILAGDMQATERAILIR